jgi:hypothetical protein
VNFPHLVLALALIILWLAEWAGAALRLKRRNDEDDQPNDFELITAATLTLLGLIIGFSFSMAISRYDQRKHYEAEEANAIGTEYVRADFLPAADAAKIRALLRKYLDQRVSFYLASERADVLRINAVTDQLQTDLWSAVRGPAVAQPTAVVSLVVSGMNDVLNSQGYAQAAWWNRIPAPAWNLMVTIAICSCLLIGYRMRRAGTKSVLLLVIPFVVSISFYLISDIDSPRGGIIRVHPQNLESLSQSLNRH